jgi:hypothetical protein
MLSGARASFEPDSTWVIVPRRAAIAPTPFQQVASSPRNPRPDVIRLRLRERCGPTVDSLSVCCVNLMAVRDRRDDSRARILASAFVTRLRSNEPVGALPWPGRSLRRARALAPACPPGRANRSPSGFATRCARRHPSVSTASRKRSTVGTWADRAGVPCSTVTAIASPSTS